MIKSLLFVGIGSLLGGIARYGLSLLLNAREPGSFPWGTLMVNLTGCFLIGILYGFASKMNWSDPLKLFLTTGLMGGFTTFSAFSYETVQMMQHHHYGIAIAYVLISVIVGIGLGFVGISFFS